MSSQAIETRNLAGIQTRPLAGALGAEVVGVDLARDASDALYAAIRQAFYDNVVLLFRGQTLTPAEQIAFTGYLGPVEEHPLRSRRLSDRR